MNYATHQPYVGSAMEMFQPRHLGAHVSSVAAFNPAPPFTGLRGLGDWFSDGVKALTDSGLSVLNAVTGVTAQQNAQKNAMYLAQIEAERAKAESESTAKMVMAGAVAVGIFGVIALAVLKK